MTGTQLTTPFGFSRLLGRIGLRRTVAMVAVLALSSAVTVVGWTYAATVPPAGCLITISQDGDTPALETSDCAVSTPLLAPGATGTFPITVDNQTDLQIRAGLTLNDLRSYENGCNRPEHTDADASCADPGLGQGELDAFLRFDLQGPTTSGGPVTSLWRGNLRELAAMPPAATQLTAAPGTTTSLAMHWTLPFETGNPTQTDSVEWTWTITAAEVPGDPQLPPAEELEPVEIIRIEGPSRVETAVEGSREMFPTSDSAPTMLLARADVATEGVTGISLAGKRGSAILLTQPDSLHPATATELTRALPDGATVLLLGGEAALSDDVADAVEDLGFVVERVGGANRAHTATLIADLVLGSSTNPLALIADGTDFRPVTVAGPAAASRGGVVLISWGSSPAAETLAWLATTTGPPPVAVGAAAGAAHPALEQVGDESGPGPAIAVAERFFGGPRTVGLATNDVFADPLTGAAHMANRGGPLLLTSPGTLDSRVIDYLLSVRPSLTTLYIYGGTAAISMVIEEDLDTLLNG